MANDGNQPNTGNSDHQATYEGFMSATKWGVALVSIVLILMAVLLA